MCCTDVIARFRMTLMHQDLRNFQYRETEQIKEQWDGANTPRDSERCCPKKRNKITGDYKKDKEKQKKQKQVEDTLSFSVLPDCMQLLQNTMKMTIVWVRFQSESGTVHAQRHSEPDMQGSRTPEATHIEGGDFKAWQKEKADFYLPLPSSPCQCC